MNSIFAQSKAISDPIEGMLSSFSMAAMDSILAFQADRRIGGDMVELGVLRGKSAAILAGRLSGSEKLRLYDIADYFDRPALAKTGANLSFNIASTLDLRKRDFRDNKRAIRFCHIDASHMFEPTMHELALADYMLAEDGVLCLDDYTNLNYSQILAATFKYLFTKRTDLTMFMVTDEKAYLCRRSKFPLYAGFVLDSILAQMAERGQSNLGIARTDDTPSYGAFYLRPKAQGETEDYYGVELYRDFYRIRDHRAPRAVARQVARKIVTGLGIRGLVGR